MDLRIVACLAVAIASGTLALDALTRAAAAGVTPSPAASPAPSARERELERRVSELEQRLSALEAAQQHSAAAVGQKVKTIDERVEAAQELADEKTKHSPVVTVDSEGLWVRSADGDYAIHPGGYAQVQGRFFAGKSPGSAPSTFALRRARLFAEGTIAKYIDYRFQNDFATNAFQDAYANVHYWEPLQFRGGKYKEQVGLERLQDDRYIMFAERGFPSQLAPDRDLGFDVHSLVYGTAEYSFGLYNGVTDNIAINNADNNSAKDFAARLFLHPFDRTSFQLGHGLGLGIAGTIGNQRGNTLDSFNSFGQSTWFTYNSGVTAAGERIRYAPQINYFRGPIGFLGEWVDNTQQVRGANAPASKTRDISNQAWQLEASYVLTGERAEFDAPVRSNRDFNPRDGTWGA